MQLTLPKTTGGGFQPGDQVINGVDYPTLTWNDSNGNHVILAADTDGDGIADAGPLPDTDGASQRRYLLHGCPHHR